MPHDDDRNAPHRANIILIGFLIVAGFYLLAEHRAHLFGVLPFLLLLSCPLMHLFMHHGHRHGGDDSSDAGTDADPSSQSGRRTRP
nr:DUF2933 domain-containing protein [Sphingopyxis indica]